MEHPALALVAVIVFFVIALLLGVLMDFPDWRKKQPNELKPIEIKQMKKLVITMIILLFIAMVSLTSCKKVEYTPCKKELTQDSIQKIFRNRLIH